MGCYLTKQTPEKEKKEIGKMSKEKERPS